VIDVIDFSYTSINQSIIAVNVNHQ